MRRRVRRWVRIGLLVLTGTILTALFGLLLILQLWPSDDFRFLGGRNPIWAGQSGPMQVDSFRGPGEEVPASEYRIYSWKQDFESVKAAAAKELPALGYELDQRKKPDGIAFWIAPDGSDAWLQVGQSRTRKEAFGGGGDENPAWVTVICTTKAPENWITHVRIAFEPTDW